MKTWLKLWMIALWLLAIAWTIYQANVSAFTWEVKLKINEWTNSCTWTGYDLGTFDASATTWVMNEVAHAIECDLYANPSKAIKLTTSDLKAWSLIITKSNIKIKWAQQTKNWSLADGSAQSTYTAFGSAQTWYTKWANKIGSLSWSVTLSWVIPAWQPAWIYTGELNLSIE